MITNSNTKMRKRERYFDKCDSGLRKGMKLLSFDGVRESRVSNKNRRWMTKPQA